MGIPAFHRKLVMTAQPRSSFMKLKPSVLTM